MGQIFYSQQEQPAERAKDSGSIDNVTAKSRFRAFLHDFHVEHGVFTYRYVGVGARKCSRRYGNI